jgi:hypothetical protein
MSRAYVSMLTSEAGIWTDTWVVALVLEHFDGGDFIIMEGGLGTFSH